MAESPRENLPVRRKRALSGPVEEYSPRPRPEPDEDPSDEDVERFSGVTVDCPVCGTELYDNVGICWNCGHDMDSPVRRRALPAWAVVVLVIAVIVTVLTMFF